jgi:hypothetical protein
MSATMTVTATRARGGKAKQAGYKKVLDLLSLIRSDPHILLSAHF